MIYVVYRGMERELDGRETIMPLTSAFVKQVHWQSRSLADCCLRQIDSEGQEELRSFLQHQQQAGKLYMVV